MKIEAKLFYMFSNHFKVFPSKNAAPEQPGQDHASFYFIKGGQTTPASLVLRDITDVTAAHISDQHKCLHAELAHLVSNLNLIIKSVETLLSNVKRLRVKSNNEATHRFS